MIVIETHVFTRLICDFLPDDDYRRLQLALMLRPEQGALVPGGQGLRKLRWGRPGRGKRGGLRILYYWDKKDEEVYLLFAYEKSKQPDLTPDQARALGRMIQEELK